MVYADPPFNTGRTQTRRTLVTTGAPEDGDRTGFGGRRYATKLLAESSYSDEFDDYLGFLAPAAGGDPARPAPHRHALPAPRLPRGALRQAAARRALRPRVLPQRADLGLRLRRQAARAAGRRSTTRSSSTSRTRAAYYFDSEARRPRAVHGARARHAGEGRAGQAAGVGDVAHDRLPHRAREDRLPDAEARGPAAALRAGLARARATCAWTRSPAPGRSAPSRRKLGRRYLLIDESPEAVRVMRERLG